MKIFNFDWLIDLEKSILWQYDKANKMKSLITQKKSWYKENVTDFITNFFKNIFNLKTANDFGLAIWGKILNFPRQITKRDNTILELSTEQYRFLLKAQILKFKMKCTIPEINRYLRIIFNESNNNNVYVIDNHNMTIRYSIEPNSMSNEIKDLIENYDFLPCPVGVRYTVSSSTNYYVVTIDVEPETAEVIFNIDGDEYVQKVIEVAEDKTITYTVRDIENGFVTQTGTLTVTEDVIIPITLQTTLSIAVNDNSADISLTINGTTYTGTGSISKVVNSGDTYSYSVSVSGYLTKTGNGTITGRLDLQFNAVSQSIMNITKIPYGTENITTMQDITLTDDCILNIDICGAKGWENDLGTRAGGRVQVTAEFNNGDVLSARKVKSVRSKSSENIGVGLWLNDTVILVAGGAGFWDSGEDNLSAGGSGYIGGKAEGGAGAWMTAKNGIGIVSGTSTRQNIEDGQASGTSTYLAFGGRGYIATGYTNTATTRIKGLAYIKIIQKIIVQQ